MKQPENPTSPKPEDDVERAVREMEDEDAGKKKDPVPGPKNSVVAAKVHKTVPIEQSIKKIKAHRKPRKKPIEKGPEHESKDPAGSGSGAASPPDAGSGGKGPKWTFLPLDWFRKS
jgi:hypothetical protein